MAQTLSPEGCGVIYSPFGTESIISQFFQLGWERLGAKPLSLLKKISSEFTSFMITISSDFPIDFHSNVHDSIPAHSFHFNETVFHVVTLQYFTYIVTL